MDLTKGSIPKVLLLFSLPIVAQMSIQPLFGVIDRIFIAQISADAFNAVINASVFQMLVIMLAAGLANGVTSYVARLVGAGDLSEADNAAWHAMIIMVAFSALTIAVFYGVERPFFGMLGLKPELFGRAHSFIQVIVLGNVTIMFTLIGANILRGEGNSVTPLLIAVVTVGLNLVLAPLLIFGPEDELFGLRVGWLGLDVFGGGLATVISRGAGCVILIAYLLLGRSVWSFSLRNFRWNPRHIAEILRVGLPMLLVNLSSWIASIVFLRVLNKHPGAVEAFGMGTQLDMLAVLPMIGLMLGVIGMVGQNFGAGNLARAERTAWAGGVYAALFALAMAFLYMIFPGFWVSLFNKGGDPEIMRLGRNFIFIVSLTYPFASLVFVLGGAFQGLGKGLPPLIITATRFILVAIPIVLILPRYIGPDGAWWATAASHVLGGIMAIVWIKAEFGRRRVEG
jgi:putative MATE family efflux protein